MSNQHALENRDDGLAHCEVCGGAEGSMPTACPGRKMVGDEADAVYAGRLNFARGPMNLLPIWWVPLERSEPDFAAVRDKRLSELTPAQREDAHELWLRENVGWMTEYHREHYRLLFKRLDAARVSSRPRYYAAGNVIDEG